MQRRVGVAAAHALLICRNNVIVLVAVAVVAHGAPLHQRADDLLCDDAPVAVALGCRHGQLHRVHRLAHVAAAADGYFFCAGLAQLNGDLLLLLQQTRRAKHRPFDLLRLHRLEFKNRGAAENGVVDVKIRVLGGGGDQRDAAVFDVFEQGLLLLFIKILDLIQIKQDAVYARKGAELCHDLLDVGGGGSGAVELAQRLVGFVGYISGERRFADARRTVEYQVGYLAALDYPAQRFALRQEVPLPDDVVERLRPKAVGKWFFHRLTLFVCRAFGGCSPFREYRRPPFCG